MSENAARPTLVIGLIFALLLAGAPAAGAAEDGEVSAASHSRNITRLGASDLGRAGLNGEVAVAGDTAIVGAGLVTDTGYHTERYNPMPCQRVSAKVVDISNPRSPRVAATIPMPTGSAASSVDILDVQTPSFRGTLAAIAIDDGPSQQGPTSCTPNPGDHGPTFTDRGIVYYDVSNPASPVLLGRYMADADSVPANAPPCAPPPEGSGVRCATGQHSVDLVRRRDGRVLSISSEPAANQGATIRPSGDIRLVEVTDPRNPTQIAAYPPLGQRPNAFSNNGCRPFVAGNAGAFNRNGTRAGVAYMDGGFHLLGLSNPNNPGFLGQLGFGDQRSVDGDAGNVELVQFARTQLALLSQDDWNSPATTLNVTNPPSLAGGKFACEANFTLFDRDRNAQLYLQQNGIPEREVVYVGRGCPTRTAAGSTVAEDPYLADPSGKIAFLDSAKVAATQPNIPNAGCRFDIRVKRAQDAGAVAVVYGRVPQAPFSNDPRSVAPGGSDDGLTIPAVQLDTPDGDALRQTLRNGQAVTASLSDAKGDWGALRVIDLSRPAAPRFIGEYRPELAEQFPPPDNGIYAPGVSSSREALAFVAWHGAGLRVLDLRERQPEEVASFVPAARPDPNGIISATTEVAGVAVGDDDTVVISDRNSGLFVLRYRDRTRPDRPTITGPRTTSDTTPTFRLSSLDAETGTRGLRFFCGFDGEELERCRSRLTERLDEGSHVLRVAAEDRAGNRSPVARRNFRIR